MAIAYPACGDSDEPTDDAHAGMGGDAGAGAGGASGGGTKSVGGSGGDATSGAGGSLSPGGAAGTSTSGGEAGASGGSAGAGNGEEGGSPSEPGAGAGGEAGSPAGPGGAGAGGFGGFSGGGAGGAGGEGGATGLLDFESSGTVADFTPEAGTWIVEDGAYVGTGPEAPASCAEDGFWMTASVLNGFSGADVRVRARLIGVDRPDKLVILRHQDSGNRIELNFRSSYVSGETVDGGDLIVQELTDCVGEFRVPPQEVLIPHALTEPIDVDIELRGQHLIVRVGDSVALDRVFSGENTLSSAAGGVGLGVNLESTVRFDDLRVEALE